MTVPGVVGGHHDLVVIGAGPWGLACAWRAARAGLAVTVVDDAGSPAGHVAAGMLSPWSEADHGRGPLHELMVAGAARWPEFAAELARDAGGTVGYHRTGTLLVAGRPEQIGPLRHLASALAELGGPGDWVSGSELRRLEPALAPGLAGGLRLDDEHQVDPRWALAALRTACAARGVTFLTPGAHRLIGEDVVRGVELADGRVVAATWTLIAAGWSAGRLSPTVPLRPIKGQILRLAAGAERPAPVSRVIRSASVYIVPRPDGEVVVGATMEEARDLVVTAGAVHDLLAEALNLVPDLADLELRESAAARRPATPDGLPALGPEGRAGLLWAVGGARHGILLAPVAADAILACLGDSARGAAAELSPTRFAPAEVAACA